MLHENNTTPAGFDVVGFRFAGIDGEHYIRHSAKLFFRYNDAASADTGNIGNAKVIKADAVLKVWQEHPIPRLATPSLKLPVTNKPKESIEAVTADTAEQSKLTQESVETFSLASLRLETASRAAQIRQKEAKRNQPVTQPPIEEPTKPEELDILRLLHAARINPTDDLPKPTLCLTVELNDQITSIGTTGNFSVLIGAAKSRKSFAVCTAIAAMINPEQLVIGCIRGTPPTGKPGVLYFDTEQSRYHVTKAVKRICLLSGIENPQHLHSFSLRPLETTQRLEAIRYAIEHTEGIGLVIIDGIRDIVFDINSPEEATTTATLLLRLTEQYGMHLLTVLHTNKGNAEARGHLGTELINKAETVIRITKDPNDRSISIVAPEMCRDRDFEPFAFSIDEQGLPVLADNWQPTAPKSSQRRPGATTQGTEKPKAKQLTNEQLILVLKSAFEGDPQTYDTTWRNLIAAAEHHGILAPSQSQAKQLLTSFVQRKFVETVKGRYTQYRSTGNYPSE